MLLIIYIPVKHSCIKVAISFTGNVWEGISEQFEI